MVTGMEKYRKLVGELAAARAGGDLLDETEAYFAQGLCDCRRDMSDAECEEADQLATAVLGGNDSPLMRKATDAVRAAELALHMAIEAFMRLRDAEVDLSHSAVPLERDIANRGFGRADVSLCVLRALGNE